MTLDEFRDRFVARYVALCGLIRDDGSDAAQYAAGVAEGWYRTHSFLEPEEVAQWALSAERTQGENDGPTTSEAYAAALYEMHKDLVGDLFHAPV